MGIADAERQIDRASSALLDAKIKEGEESEESIERAKGALIEALEYLE